MHTGEGTARQRAQLAQAFAKTFQHTHRAQQHRDRRLRGRMVVLWRDLQGRHPRQHEGDRHRRRPHRFVPPRNSYRFKEWLVRKRDLPDEMTLFFGFHRFFTADDVAGVNTPADLIH